MLWNMINPQRLALSSNHHLLFSKNDPPKGKSFGSHFLGFEKFMKNLRGKDKKDEKGTSSVEEKKVKEKEDDHKKKQEEEEEMTEEEEPEFDAKKSKAKQEKADDRNPV